LAFKGLHLLLHGDSKGQYSTELVSSKVGCSAEVETRYSLNRPRTCRWPNF